MSLLASMLQYGACIGSKPACPLSCRRAGRRAISCLGQHSHQWSWWNSTGHPNWGHVAVGKFSYFVQYLYISETVDNDDCVDNKIIRHDYQMCCVLYCVSQLCIRIEHMHVSSFRGVFRFDFCVFLLTKVGLLMLD